MSPTWKAGSAAVTVALLVLNAAACLPAWVKQPAEARWRDDTLRVQASGGVDGEGFGAACTSARRFAEEVAIKTAAEAWSIRFPKEAATREPNIAELARVQPSSQSCYVLVELTLIRGP